MGLMLSVVCYASGESSAVEKIFVVMGNQAESKVEYNTLCLRCSVLFWQVIKL